jgi:hypothetical protein
MRESRAYGSVRGARGNSRPYREAAFCCTAYVACWISSSVATRGARVVTHSIAQRRFILVLNQKTRPPEAAAETIPIYYYYY